MSISWVEMKLPLLVLCFLLGAGLSFFGCAPNDTRYPQSTYTSRGVGVLSSSATITGRALYEKIFIPVRPDGTQLPRTISVLPVRHADVIALDPVSLREVQTSVSSTGPDGEFSVTVPAGASFYPVVRFSTKNSLGHASLEIRNPDSDTIYLLGWRDPATHAPFVAPGDGGVRTLQLSTIPVYPSAFRDSAVPSMLDALMRGVEMATANGATLPLLTLYWNTTSPYGTYYSRTSGPDDGPAIWVLGGDPDTDNTDEYDDYVIHHEFAHFYVDKLSRDSSLGGNHGLSDTLYPSLGYSEGLASFLAGVIEVTPALVDSVGITGPSPAAYVINLEGGRGPAATRGIRNELSVAEVLWDLVDGTEGRVNQDAETVTLTFGALNSVLAAFRSTKLYLSLEDLLEALVASHTIDRSVLQSLLVSPENQQMSCPPTPGGPDEFPRKVVPGSSTFDSCQTRFGTWPLDQLDGVDVSNRFFRLDLTAPTAVTIRMQLLGGADGTNSTGTNVDLFVFTPDNALATDVAGTILTPYPRPEDPAEAATGSLAAGTYIIHVCGRPDLFWGFLTNEWSQTVPYRLDVTSP